MDIRKVALTFILTLTTYIGFSQLKYKNNNFESKRNECLCRYRTTTIDIRTPSKHSFRYGTERMMDCNKIRFFRDIIRVNKYYKVIISLECNKK